MDHLAIMHKHFMNKVLSGEKTVESRWSKDRRSPYGKIQTGDTIYFKFSSGPVAAKADVSKVDSFSIVDDRKGVEIYVDAHYKALGLETLSRTKQFLHNNQSKYYVTFITLKKVRKIEDFNINKDGFGIRASWIVIEDINKLKRK
ncbi:MAG: ASC-1-like (ASCH) protein [Desulforhopalus sp.]|jgi:ASC-1-like (ASCH) protein